MSSTSRLAAWDKRFTWHPFTQMQDWMDESPLIIESGKGSYLYDTSGRRYLDGVSSLWCNVHGHRVPAIDTSLRKQLRQIAHSTFLGLSNIPAIELAKQIIDITPRGLKRVFYSDSGSESVEIALKMAYQYWQHKGLSHKKKFIHLKNAYHGDTIGSVSVGGIDLFHRIFKPLLFKSIGVNAPDRYHEGYKGSEEAYANICAARVEIALKRHADKTAALVMEPLVQGAAGMITHPKGYLKKIRRLTQKHNVLLILDEVATGFGRTGRMFACQHEHVKPDFLCLAKGLTGGYLPLAATVTTEAIYKAFLGRFDEFKAFYHGHTYTANPLACRAALANLELFKRDRVISRIQRLQKEMTQGLRAVKPHPHVGDIRQVGLMAGIELVQDKSKRRPYKMSLKMGIRVCTEMRRHGVIVRPLGNVVVLMPPYSFTPQQIKSLCQSAHRSIHTCTADPVRADGVRDRS